MKLEDKLSRAILKYYESGLSREECFKKIRDIIQDIPDFNIREKARAYLVGKRLAVQVYSQEGEIWKLQDKKFRQGINKVREHKNGRYRKAELKLRLRMRRADKQVFFICSWHNKCAEGHKAYQGKIYVDRFWRNTLSDDPEIYRAVEAYIRNHDILTVQEIVRAPVFMIVRPYCKHQMIPLDTDTVLHSSVNKIRKDLSKKKNPK